MQPSLSHAFRLSRRDHLLLAFVASLFCVAAATLDAGGDAPAPLRIEQARCDPALAGGKVGSCTLVIRNPGREADRLVAIEMPGADRVEIHSMSVTDGIMQMRRLAQGVDIPAGTTVDFRERGYHLMVVGLKAPLAAGDTIEATLNFERSGPRPAAFRVENELLQMR
ncbi:copper chaperone PCu(A)C [Methylosinus sp. Sm6]|uniref:copper chaperone PCu(A)C n=1 Tax=Methylosinus sp. Sm6 TaxID=2866948 RepID=UPI001C992F91|nr:copper chaperone PCu(A)C [Methylosinus sp. Sm6]MBY6242274.1 copper chaperone PCu(A)C [Methylosinus sp. Sm6]